MAPKKSVAVKAEPDGIELAFNQFVEIVKEVDALEKAKWSEADTRLKVIDKIIFEVLGWEKNKASTEERAGSGFTDYTLRVQTTASLIVEAKKDAISFDFNNRQSGQAYKLNGPVFNVPAKEAIEQTIIYSAFKNCELACVTNGHEWIIFRANRLGDGLDTLDGKGFVFASLTDIQANFEEFYDLLSRASVSSLKYRGEFQLAEEVPIRDQSFLRPLRSPSSKRLVPRGEFAADFDALMATFFERLKGDQDKDMIEKCFVVTKESHAADERLLRIAEDLVTKVRQLDTDTGTALAELIEAAKLQNKNRFVLLVGNKGAGKSTFIERFFKSVCPKAISEHLVALKVDVKLNSGDITTIVQWLNQRLVEECERAVFSPETDWDDFVGKAFFDDYQRWATATMSHLYSTDKNAFKIEFGRHIEKVRDAQPHEYIRRLIGYITKSQKKIPCLIFDNTDHFTIQFQEAVFQYARSIYESEFCVVILPITDNTSWQLSKQGALQSFESEVLSLPVPHSEKVIEKRINYLLEKLDGEDDNRKREYFLSRGIKLKITDIVGFAVNLNRVFIESRNTANWIGGLSNHDIRRLLEVTKDIIASPHLKLDDLLKAHIAGKSEAVPDYRIKMAIVKRRYDIYPTGEHSFVQNMFALSVEPATTPLLGLRILQFLSDATVTPETNEQQPIPVDDIYEHFTAMGIHPAVVNKWLAPLLQAGLILNYDPTVTELSELTLVEVSPSGKTHLTWATEDMDYLQMMKDVTPLREKSAYETIQETYSDYKHKWPLAIMTFIDYLLREDGMYCRVPEHVGFKNQVGLTKKYLALLERLHVENAALTVTEAKTE